MQQNLFDDAIMKVPKILDQNDEYITYAYKDYTIQIQRPPKGTHNKFIYVWSKIKLSLTIMGDGENRDLLALAVDWIDRIGAKKK